MQCQFANHITHKCFCKFTLQESMGPDYCYLLGCFARDVQEVPQQLSVVSEILCILFQVNTK